MAQEGQVADLPSLLSHFQAFVTYKPLRSEVDFYTAVTLPQVPVHEIPPRAGIDPFEEAKNVMEKVPTESVCILIPGRRFDATGTRLGQGGGWYDRFLSHVPRAWLRIGFCFDDQLSPTPLKRESWDQAMDYVVVVNRAGGAPTVYSSEGNLS